MTTSIQNGASALPLNQLQYFGVNSASSDSATISEPQKNVMAFTELASPFLATLLTNQSVMTSPAAGPKLSAPQQNSEKMSAERTSEIVQLSSTVTENDDNVATLALVASTASTVLDTHLGAILANTSQDQHQSVSSDVRPTAAALTKGSEEATAEETGEMVKMTAALKGGDAGKMERIAAAAAAVFAPQASINQVTGKSAENSKGSTESVTTTSSGSSAAQVRSQAAVDGGTDITAVDTTPASPAFVRIMGSDSQLILSNTMIKVLNQAENQSNKDSAMASMRALASAKHAGDKMIDSSRQNFNGAIASGALSTTFHAGAAFQISKSLGKENTSLKQNVKDANHIDSALQRNDSSIQNSSDSMLNNKGVAHQNVKATMSESHAEKQLASSEHRRLHNEIQNDSLKARSAADLARHGGQVAGNTVEGAFGVQAAEEQKQAEVSRADQNINSEVAQSHDKTAKKASETQASLQRTFENTLSNNNSAASTIAERMR